MENKEIEVRFLEINKESLVKKLLEVGAKDFGEVMLEEIIFYDPEGKWKDQEKRVRLRKSSDKIKISYKEIKEKTIDGTIEIEFEVSDMSEAEKFLEKVGLSAFRHQQKKRHTFELSDVVIDIDTWPRIPTYVELEGPSESAIKEVAEKLGLEWTDVSFELPSHIIEGKYGIPVRSMKWFTFDRFE